MNKICVFPGSFNPFTLGHLDVVKGALHYFEEVIVAVAEITYKQNTPSAEVRAEIAKKSLDGLRGVRVECFKGMLTDYLFKKGCKNIVRGIRDEKDRVYEKALLDFYKKTDADIEATYIAASRPFISSGTVRSILNTNDVELKKYVAENAIEDVIKYYG